MNFKPKTVFKSFKKGLSRAISFIRSAKPKRSPITSERPNNFESPKNKQNFDESAERAQAIDDLDNEAKIIMSQINSNPKATEAEIREARDKMIEVGTKLRITSDPFFRKDFIDPKKAADRLTASKLASQQKRISSIEKSIQNGEGDHKGASLLKQIKSLANDVRQLLKDEGQPNHNQIRAKAYDILDFIEDDNFSMVEGEKPEAREIYNKLRTEVTEKTSITLDPLQDESNNTSQADSGAPDIPNRAKPQWTQEGRQSFDGQPASQQDNPHESGPEGIKLN